MLMQLRAAGIDETVAGLAELDARVRNKIDPLTHVAELLHQHLEAAYTSEGAGSGSGPWTPLTRRYGAWKHRHGPGVPLLVGLRPVHKGSRARPSRPESYTPSGAMRRQVLAPLDDELTWQITEDKMHYTVQSGIAVYHQTGTRRMVPRPPVDPPPSFSSEIDDEFVTWLNGLISETGLG